MQISTVDRSLDPGEAFFCLADQVSCMNFVFFAERIGKLESQHIREALDALQLQNPLLQVQIRWDGDRGLCFVYAPNKPIDLATREVDGDAWQKWIECELSKPFAEDVAPLVRCLYLQMQSPRRCVLALCFHHSIADGRSAESLLRSLLDRIATGPTSDQSPPVAPLPPMHQVFPPAFQWRSQPDAKKATLATMFGGYQRHGAIPPMTCLASGNPDRLPKFIQLKLPPGITRQLVSRSREQATSIHGLICGAQLLAQFKRLAQNESVTYFLSSPVDFRSYVEPIQPTSPTALYVSMISAAFAIDSRTDVWQLARDVMTQTRLQLARGEGHLFYEMYGLESAPLTSQQMASAKKRIAASWHNTMVSNVGRVLTVANDPAVQAISFALCPMPYQVLFNAVTTYQDQLILNLGYDAARLSPALASDLATAMHDILCAAVPKSNI